jgi:hypothetical protein
MMYQRNVSPLNFAMPDVTMQRLPQMGSMGMPPMAQLPMTPEQSQMPQFSPLQALQMYGLLQGMGQKKKGPPVMSDDPDHGGITGLLGLQPGFLSGLLG